MSARHAARCVVLCLLAAGCDDDGSTPADAGAADAGIDAEVDGGPGACVDDGREDDDTFEDAAYVLPGDGPIEGMICPGDDDVIAFDVDAPCPLIVELTHSHAEGDLDLLITEGTGQRIASGDSVDDDERAEVVLPAAGEYYAIVYGYDGASAAYSLAIDVRGHDGGDGRCAPLDTCSTGYALDGFGECFDCADGHHDGGDGSCVPLGACVRDYADGGDGECWPLGSCAPGHHPTIDRGCVPTAACDDGRDDGTGRCAADCARGFHDDGAGACVPANLCGIGYQLAGDDTCRPLDMCVEGFTPDAAGVCQADLDCDASPDTAGAGFDDAAPLPLGQSVYGVICPGDVDVFAVDLDTPCPTAIRLSFSHETADLDLEWVRDLGDRNDDGEVLVEGASATDDEHLEWTGSGRYYARVFGYLGDEQGRYAVRVDSAGHDGGDGTCHPFGICAAGYALDDDGGCTRCADGFRDGGDGACVPLGRCTPGFDDDGAGRCAAPGACAPGSHDGGDGTCVPADSCLGRRLLDDGRCVCPEGTVDGGGGACTAPGTCADGFHDGGAGECLPEDRCADGFVPAPGLRCRAPLDCGPQRDDGVGACGDGCADGAHDGGDGTCVADGACLPGWHDGGDGACVVDGGCADGSSLDAAGICHPTWRCPADDPAEPDARWSDARPLAPGGTARGVVCAGDGDLFAVQQAPDCASVARLDFAGAEADLSLSLLAGPETGVQGGGSGPLAASHDDEDRERIVIPPGPAGVVFLLVSGPPGAEARYRLRLDADAARCGRGAQCPDGEQPDGAGGCLPEGRCAPGFADGGDGRCLPVGRCALGFHDGGDGACVATDRCAAGWHLRPDGACARTALCPDGERDDGAGACGAGPCAAGYADGGDGACVAAGACATGFADGGDGICRPAGACAEGFAADPRGRCLPDMACPDDDPGEADEPIALAPDAIAYGITCAADPDGDHYRIAPPPGCRLSATLRFAHASGDLALALTTADGEVLDRADSATDDERLIPGDVDGEAELELRVEPADGVRYSLSYRCQ